MHSNLLTLPPGVHTGVQIRPRWPARHVHVDADVLGKLQAMQAALPAPESHPDPDTSPKASARK
ncbi:hypothetical protein [Burkholderia sp. BCC0405]|uniref:hypothetical protein n=1 Tax=Burkholderia sp. BCC0405 TaxID=2676298 RepID=UPI00158D7060|nr:hypothetical protein [Burkholderia sp. BCC0405]